MRIDKIFVAINPSNTERGNKTLFRRCCDVMTSQQRQSNVILMLCVSLEAGRII